jgi:hypothetical protein
MRGEESRFLPSLRELWGSENPADTLTWPIEVAGHNLTLGSRMRCLLLDSRVAPRGAKMLRKVTASFSLNHG